MTLQSENDELREALMRILPRAEAIENLLEHPKQNRAYILRWVQTIKTVAASALEGRMMPGSNRSAGFYYPDGSVVPISRQCGFRLSEHTKCIRHRNHDGPCEPPQHI